MLFIGWQRCQQISWLASISVCSVPLARCKVVSSASEVETGKTGRRQTLKIGLTPFGRKLSFPALDCNESACEREHRHAGFFVAETVQPPFRIGEGSTLVGDFGATLPMIGPAPDASDSAFIRPNWPFDSGSAPM
jgi:hypothetical protein